jgi:hypothetical protein
MTFRQRELALGDAFHDRRGVPFSKKIENPSDVRMNMMALTVVPLERNVVAPLPLKTVWLDPSKGAPCSMLAPLLS